MRAFPNPCPASLVFGVTILPLLDSPVLGCGKRARRGMNMAYGSGIAKGMSLTLKSLFRPVATLQYPEETRDVPVYARTNLLWFEERCTGCSTCAQACPDGCILVATSQDAEGRRNIDRYEIDFRICMYCGLCTEACPYEAIQPGGPLDDAVYVFDEMYRDKHALTRVARGFLGRNDNTYPNGMKAPAPDADFHRL